MSPSPLDTARARAVHAFRRLPGPLQYKVLRHFDRYPAWEGGKAPEAPPPPAGMGTGDPDFVGVGVPKCGTTWWFSLLMAHPSVHVAHEKELQFFNRRFFAKVAEHGATEEDFEAYRRWFPRPPGTITGEWTPHYAFSYRLPPVLAALAPRAKVLVMVRDPLERYRSDVSRLTTRKRLEIARYRGMARGFYPAVLRPWEEVYGASDLLLLQFETCLAEPEAELDKTFAFLGIDEGFRPPGFRAAVNRTKTKRTVDDDVERLLVRLYEPEVVDLATRYRHLDVARWPHFAHLADEVADRRASRPAIAVPATPARGGAPR